MARIGITTTIPIEVVYAAGHVPVDLNNAFVSRPDARECVEDAELAGFPRNLCAWIKGIYGTVKREEDLEAVIAVTQGDCSNTHALMEVLQAEGVEVIPFAYPYERDYDMLRVQVERLMERLGTGWGEVEESTERLDVVRKKAHRVDEMTWKENLVTGYENHYYLVSCSDMQGDPEYFGLRLDEFLGRVEGREALREEVRLAYVGVPPISTEIYFFLEERGARVVFNETQRQFSIPYSSGDLVSRYLEYTYPYSIFHRLRDILEETRRRGIDGVIHYVQSFCFRQVEDLIIRRSLDLPVLTVEMDSGTRLDARTRMRLESFVNMLRGGR
jgi:benzoyl-CoA reductase/2-hydroxyglutaryl-CoA dehydratase subunit BcrC/BadD/HgdB